ncbi:MAG: helix-turn-helix domain-containing protein [Propionibacteriaceae bacterium]|nr:helix-turn-helix domain-containing protein [Propionibacteriaceae bacterium]
MRGRHIAVGIHSGRAEPLDPKKVNDVRQAAMDFTSPVVRTQCHEIRVGDGVIVLIGVEPGSTVHETSSGEVYLRVGDESRKLTYPQRRELAYDRGSEVFSATVLDSSSAKDLDVKAAKQYQKAIGAATVESMLAARDLIDSEGRLRVAAWLMFSKHPGRGFPNAHVRVLQYAATERGTGAAVSLIAGHDLRCEGRLPEQIESAAALVDEWMPGRKALAMSGRFEDQPMLPRQAWLEGLVNAVIHRSYSVQGDHVRVELFPNRIEITSPGCFPGFVDPSDPISIMRYARNPRIARAMAALGYAYELGEGIKRMFASMRERGLDQPMYSQVSGRVVLTLFANPASGQGLSKGATIVAGIMRQTGVPLKTGEVAELTGYSRPTAIRHLITLREAGVVVWQGKSPRDPNASWSLA